MLGKSNDVNDAQTSGVLIQYLAGNEYFKKNDNTGSSSFGARRTFGDPLQRGGNTATHQLKRSGQRTADILRADRGTEDCIDV